MNNSSISLLIQGNKRSHGGFSPLLKVGIIPIDEINSEKMDKARAVSENPMYVIRHADRYVIYTLQDSKVKSCDGTRRGRMTISLAIPKNKCLSDGHSPYEVLKLVYEKFQRECMTLGEDGLYCFLSNDYDDVPFEQILFQYNLEDYNGKYRPMLGTGGVGIVCANTEEKLSLLFKDSQYEQFENYNEVEVGMFCNPTIDIEIPRKPVYRLYVNNTFKKGLSNDGDSYSSLNEIYSDSEYYNYDIINFTLRELLDSPDNTLFDDKVKLDFQQERIDCEVLKTPKDFHYNLMLEGDVDDEVRMMLQAERLQLKFGPFFLDKHFWGDKKIILRGEEVQTAYPNWSKKVEGKYTFSVKVIDKVITLSVKKEKVETVKPGWGFGDVKYPPVPKGNGSNSLKIVVKSEQDYDYEVLNIEVKKEGTNSWSLCQPLNFKKEKKDSYKAELEIDSDWMNSDVQITIENKNERKKQNFFKTIEKETSVTMKEKWDVIPSKNFWQKYRAKIIVFIVGIILGGLIIGGGATAYLLYLNKKQEKPQDEIVSMDEHNKLKKECSELKTENEKLTNKVDSLINVFESKKDNQTKTPSVKNEPKENSLEDEVVALVNHCIENKNFKELDDFKRNPKFKKLPDEIKKALPALYWGYHNKKGKQIVYNNSQKTKVLKVLNEEKPIYSLDQIKKMFNDKIKDKI